MACVEIVVALQQTLNCAVEAPFGKASHHQQIIAQRGQRFIKCSRNVLTGITIVVLNSC